MSSKENYFIFYFFFRKEVKMSSEERSHKYGGMRLHRHSRREFKYFKSWLKSQKVCKSQSFDEVFESFYQNMSCPTMKVVQCFL